MVSEEISEQGLIFCLHETAGSIGTYSDWLSIGAPLWRKCLTIKEI